MPDGVWYRNSHFLQTDRLHFFCCSVAKSCPTPCDPMDCSTPGFPVFNYLPKFTQTHCTLSRWCHPTISSSVTPFSSCPQSFPVSGSFSSFISGGQSNGASASASILPVNIQGLFPLGLTSLISLQFKGLWRVLQNHSSKASVLRCSAFFMVQLSHPYVTTGKIHSFD